MRVRIELTFEEASKAVWAGVLRNFEAELDTTRGTRYGHPKDRWQADIIGALGEWAVAKWLGLPFDAHIGRTYNRDVGPFEVRSTNYPNGKLLINPGETGPYILVNPTDSILHYDICGWINAEDPTVPTYRDPKIGHKGYGPVYTVPEGALHDPRELCEAYAIAAGGN